jgi:hypothetical protein
MMTPCAERPKLSCIVEVDEKYFGGKPRYQAGKNSIGVAPRGWRQIPQRGTAHPRSVRPK